MIRVVYSGLNKYYLTLSGLFSNFKPPHHNKQAPFAHLFNMWGFEIRKQAAENQVVFV